MAAHRPDCAAPRLRAGAPRTCSPDWPPPTPTTSPAIRQKKRDQLRDPEPLQAPHGRQSLNAAAALTGAGISWQNSARGRWLGPAFPSPPFAEAYWRPSAIHQQISSRDKAPALLLEPGLDTTETAAPRAPRRAADTPPTERDTACETLRRVGRFSMRRCWRKVSAWRFGPGTAHGRQVDFQRRLHRSGAETRGPSPDALLQLWSQQRSGSQFVGFLSALCLPAPDLSYTGKAW
jgi:hypothetical protein